MTDAAPPAWAKGFDRAWLAELAAPFKADTKPYCYGAFGCPNERDVADALEGGDVIYTKAGGSTVAAVAIFRRLASASTHSDFARRQARIAAGDVLVRHIAGTLEGKRRVLSALLERAAKAPAIWVECHVENAETVALLAELGFAPVMTKVSASSDLRGLYLRGETAGRLPSPLAAADVAALAVVAPDWLTPDERSAIEAELRAYERANAGAWADHYSSYNKRHTWSSFALAGFDQADPSFIIKPSEMSKAWKTENPARLKAACGPTIAAAAFPALLDVVARIPGPKQRVRLMRLGASGGELTRHADITDPEAGTADGLIARMHVPLTSPPECLFRGWALDGAEHRLHFPEAALCYLDTRKPHAVINPGAADRVHLVVDTIATPALRALIVG